MTIYSIQKRFWHSLQGWLAFCGIATLGAGTMLCGTAYGQADSNSGFAVPASWAQPTGPTTTATATDKSQLSFNGNSYRVVNSASVRNASTNDASRVMQAAGLAENSMLARASTVAPVAYNEGCTTCGNSGCGGACGGGSSNYGGYSGGIAGYQPRFGSGAPTACGTPCNPYRYASAEALYMRRNAEDVVYSPNYRLEDFDYRLGGRVTVGAVPDCRNGYEVTYTVIDNWRETASLTAAPGTRIRTTLVDNLGVDSGSLIAFVNTPATLTTPNSFSVFQSQFYDTDFQSLEASKTLVGFDLVKVLYGFRYIELDEDFGYSSRNNLGNTGDLFSSVQNRLFGAQIGIDGLYPISCHGFVDFRARAGAFLNFADSTTRLFNDGGLVLANADDDAQLAGFFELGSGVRYQLGEALSVRAGGEFWYLAGAATAPSQLGNVITSNVGNRINVNDDVYFFGISAGAEYKF